MSLVSLILFPRSGGKSRLWGSFILAALALVLWTYHVFKSSADGFSHPSTGRFRLISATLGGVTMNVITSDGGALNDEASKDGTAIMVTPADGTLDDEAVAVRAGTLIEMTPEHGALPNGTLGSVTLANGTLVDTTLEDDALKDGTLENMTPANGTLDDATAAKDDGLREGTLKQLADGTVNEMTQDGGTLKNMTLTDATVSDMTREGGTLKNMTLTDATVNDMTQDGGTLKNMTLTDATVNDMTREGGPQTLNDAGSGNSTLKDGALNDARPDNGRQESGTLKDDAIQVVLPNSPRSPAADSPPSGPPTVYDRAFATLDSFQQRNPFRLAKVATFNLVSPVPTPLPPYELLSLPVPHLPEKLNWRDAYPVWVNESRAVCPKILEPDYPEWVNDTDAIVARVPCDEPSDSFAKDIKWIQQLLTIAGVVIKANRPWLPVVLLSSCRPPPNLFHCSRLVSREGDVWLYNLTTNDMLTRVQPLGSCAMAQSINGNVTVEQRVAYATVLHSSDRYVCGALVLGRSITRTGTTHDMIVLVSKEITEESRRGLQEAGWIVKEIERLRNPNAQKGTYNEWNYSKLRLWQQTEYSKLLFIDSDLLLLTSVDFLFSYPEISARGNDGSDFNSGVMVVEPSDCTFEILMENVKRVSTNNGGDQGYLNNVFTWWHRLPESINTLKPVWTADPVKKQEIIAFKSRLFSEEPPRIQAIHYLGVKPWRCYRDFDCNVLLPEFVDFANEAAHKRWWGVHDSMPDTLQRFCWLAERDRKDIKERIEGLKASNVSREYWDFEIKDRRRDPPGA